MLLRTLFGTLRLIDRPDEFCCACDAWQFMQQSRLGLHCMPQAFLDLLKRIVSGILVGNILVPNNVWPIDFLNPVTWLDALYAY
jgi:hypothetical protein